MDWIFVIILGLLLFGIPELLRSKNKQKYEYPEIPHPEQKMYRRPLSYEGEGVGMECGLEETTEGKSNNIGKVVMPVPVGVSPHVEEKNSWSGQLSLPQVVNGVIFAEIVQPPRAKRPIPHWWRK